MSELRLLGCAVLLNLGVGAVLGVGIARYMIEAVPRIATVGLTELVAEHAERAANTDGSAAETAALTRAWARALEAALSEVAERHGAVLLPVRGVAAGAPDLTGEVRAEIAHVLAHGGVLAHRSALTDGDSLADTRPVRSGAAAPEDRP